MTAVLVGVVPVSAFAQDASKLGLVMATPGSVSVIWRVSDRAAIRPEIGFATSTTTQETPIGDAQVATTTITPAFSVLFYMGQWEGLRTYVSPRYVYSRAHAEASSPGSSHESTATSHSVSGSFGAEYALHSRFAVFGELGINFSHADPGNVTTNSWNQRSAVGVIFNF
jgi:hypothetical protein